MMIALHSMMQLWLRAAPLNSILSPVSLSKAGSFKSGVIPHGVSLSRRKIYGLVSLIVRMAGQGNK